MSSPRLEQSASGKVMDSRAIADEIAGDEAIHRGFAISSVVGAVLTLLAILCSPTTVRIVVLSSYIALLADIATVYPHGAGPEVRLRQDISSSLLI